MQLAKTQKKVLSKYPYDGKRGNIAIHDANALASAVESIKEKPHAYNTMLYLIEQYVKLSNENSERGSRIAMLQKYKKISELCSLPKNIKESILNDTFKYDLDAINQKVDERMEENKLERMKNKTAQNIEIALGENVINDETREQKKKFMKKSEANYTEHRYLALSNIEDIISFGDVRGRILRMALKDSAIVIRIVATDLCNKYNILNNGEPVELTLKDNSPKVLERYNNDVIGYLRHYQKNSIRTSLCEFCQSFKQEHQNAYYYFLYKFGGLSIWMSANLLKNDIFQEVIITDSLCAN